MMRYNDATVMSAFERLAPVLKVAAMASVLVYILAIHLTWIRALPDPIFQSDSPGYFEPALSLISGHQFILDLHRTPGYPLVLYAVLRATHSFHSLLIVQHLIAIMTGLLAAYTSRRLLSMPWSIAIGVFGLSCAFPASVVAAHTILTENVYACALLMTLVCYGHALKHDRLPPWLLIGVAAGILVLIRPVAYAVILAMILLLLVRFKLRRAVAVLLSFICGIAVVLGPWCLYNARQRGFFGVDRFAGVSLFGPTAQFLEPGRLKDPALREVLVPIYNEHREKLADWAWVRSDRQGPVQALLRARNDRLVLDPVLRHLAVAAILHRPAAFVGDQIRLFFRFLWMRSAVPSILLDRGFTFFVYRGLLIFARAAAAVDPGSLQWLRHSPDAAQRRLIQMEPLLRLEPVAASAYLETLNQTDLYPYDKVLRLWWWLAPVIQGMRWLPMLAVVGFGALLADPRRRFLATSLAMVIAFHIVMTNLGGDGDPRHAAPLEPLYWILAVAGSYVLAASLRRRTNIHIKLRSPSA